ncbi:MAG: carboxypeptidase regulatory-like domain-containing protein, partial [Sarcina sp.]
MTDANGNYSMNSIPISNIYNIIATAQGKLISQSTPFTLSLGQTTTVNFTLQNDPNASLGAISGALKNLNSSSIAGAIVLLYNMVNGSRNLMTITYTDTAGIFVFSELEPGNYSITINALGYMQTETNASVQNGKIFTLSKILSQNPQAPDGIVSGIITDSTNNAVSGADVILYSISTDNSLTPVAFTTTNTSGIYTFINVSAGNYLVKSNQSQIVTVNTSTTPNSTTTFNSSTLPSSTYDVALGTLSNGATINSVNYAGLIGGSSDGSSTVTVNVTTAGSYNIALKYIGPDVNRPLKVDINGVNTGTTYSLPPTAGWTVNDALVFTIPVNLTAGNNTIKFHGDGINFSQNLGTFKILIQAPTPILSYNMNKSFNGVADYLDITRDLSKVQNLTFGAIAVKFKSTSTTPSQAIFTMSDSTNAATYLSIIISNGNFRYELKQNGTQIFGYTIANITLTDGNIHTALINVASRGIEGYIDGFNTFSVPTSNNFFSSITGENTLNIGRLLNNTTTGQWYFNGTIEYIDIYSSELTISQAQAISINSYKPTPVLPS